MKLPLFNNKKIVYKSLKEFSFNSFECENDITLEMLNNLNINIDNAPSLENFTIRCVASFVVASIVVAQFAASSFVVLKGALSPNMDYFLFLQYI